MDPIKKPVTKEESDAILAKVKLFGLTLAAIGCVYFMGKSRGRTDVWIYMNDDGQVVKRVEKK